MQGLALTSPKVAFLRVVHFLNPIEALFFVFDDGGHDNLAAFA